MSKEYSSKIEWSRITILLISGALLAATMLLSYYYVRMGIYGMIALGINGGLAILCLLIATYKIEW